MSELKRTQLYDVHVAAGASMVDFGGWERPIQYPSGIVAEHLYTRHACSLFDVSHMGRVLVEGPDRVAFLQHVLSSNVESLDLNMAQYCIIPTENGSAVDDAYLYRFEEKRFLLVVNAANTEKDLAHLREELELYMKGLSKRATIIVANKMDLPGAEENLELLRSELSHELFEIIPVCAADGELGSFKETIRKAVEARRKSPFDF